ncbi:hypothetical protein [Micromonospora sp. NPDC005220]|uniref:hypothetical protein n=1 Tax=Micromonospora sp. NPDC005220 TaxID=3155589 RepID=UPI0033BEC969
MTRIYLWAMIDAGAPSGIAVIHHTPMPTFRRLSPREASRPGLVINGDAAPTAYRFTWSKDLDALGQ